MGPPDLRRAIVVPPPPGPVSSPCHITSKEHTLFSSRPASPRQDRRSFNKPRTLSGIWRAILQGQGPQGKVCKWYLMACKKEHLIGLDGQTCLSTRRHNCTVTKALNELYILKASSSREDTTTTCKFHIFEDFQWCGSPRACCQTFPFDMSGCLVRCLCTASNATPVFMSIYTWLSVHWTQKYLIIGGEKEEALWKIKKSKGAILYKTLASHLPSEPLQAPFQTFTIQQFPFADVDIWYWLSSSLLHFPTAFCKERQN